MGGEKPMTLSQQGEMALVGMAGLAPGSSPPDYGPSWCLAAPGHRSPGKARAIALWLYRTKETMKVNIGEVIRS